jgi:hypothetical protein
MSYANLSLIHSIAAYAWFGSFFGTLIFATLASRRSPEGVVLGAVAMVRFSTIIGLPAAIILLLAGFAMMGQAGLNYGATWVSIGFATWLIAAVAGSGLQHPTARRMRNAAPGSPGQIREAKKILWIGAAQIIVIAIGIWAMSAQPGA